MEAQRNKIMASKELDQKKKDELMEKAKQKQAEEDKVREKKQKLLVELKEKENKIMIGQKKNEEELKKYNQELTKIEELREDKKYKQEQMQKDIAGNYVYYNIYRCYSHTRRNRRKN